MIIYTVIVTAPLQNFYPSYTPGEITNSFGSISQVTLDSLGAILSISICLLILRVKLFGGTSREIKAPELSAWHANSRRIYVTAGTATEEEVNNPNLDLPLLSPVRSPLSERRPHSQEISRDHETEA